MPFQTSRTRPIFALAASLSAFACEPYQPLVCEPCTDACSDVLSCELGRCIAPGAMCGLECTSLDPCSGPGLECVDGLCVDRCDSDRECAEGAVCTGGRCARRCVGNEVCPVAIVDLGLGRVPSAEIDVVIRPLGAQVIQLSNVSSFSVDHASTTRIDAEPGASEQRVSWDLDRGLEPCPANAINDCRRSLYARFIDARGQPIEIWEGSVLVDRRPPGFEAGSIVFELRPPPGALIPAVEKLAVGAVATLNARFDEPLASVAVLLDGAEDSEWVTLVDDGARYTFTTTIGATRAEGRHPIAIRAVDRVGHEAILEPDLGPLAFEIDRTPPSPPVTAEGGLVLHRDPPDAFVFGPNGAVEPEALVILGGEEEELIRVYADRAGALANTSLPRPDVAAIYARAVDAAGNASELVHVAQVRAEMQPFAWGLSEPNNSAAEAYANPRSWTSAATYVPEPRAGAGATFDPLTRAIVIFGGLADDGASLRPVDEHYTLKLSRSPEWRWKNDTGLTPPALENASIAAFPRHRGYMVVGGDYNQPCFFYGPDGWSVRSADSSWCPADAVVYDRLQDNLIGVSRSGQVSRWDGEWTFSAGSRLPHDFDAPFGIAHDPMRDELIFVSMAGEVATWSAGAWTVHAALPRGRFDCRESLDAPQLHHFPLNPALVFDEAHDHVVLLANEGEYVTLYRWTGSEFVRLPVQGRRPPARFGASLVFDPDLGEVVMFGGLDLNQYRALDGIWSWNGESWRELGDVDQGPVAQSHSWMTHSSLIHDRKTHGTMLLGKALRCARDDAGELIGPTTWIWDGRRWFDAGVPLPNLGDVRGVYHDALERVLVFADPWTAYTWAGDRWEPYPISSSGVPAIFWYQSDLEYDAARDEILVAGMPSGGSGTALAMWRLPAETRTWSRVEPVSPWPSAREAPALIYDRATSRTALVGGSSADPATSGEVWWWDGSTFTSAGAGTSFPFGYAPAEPNPQAITIDETLGTPVFYFSGVGMRHTPSGWAPRWFSELGADRGHLVAYDAHRRESLIFGGRTGPYAPASSARMYLDAGAVIAPPRLVDAMFDRVATNFVPSPIDDSLWSLVSHHPGDSADVPRLEIRHTRFAAYFDLSRPFDHLSAAPVAGPSPRAALHEQRRTLVVFPGVESGRTWTSTGAAWHMSADGAFGPPARRDHQMAYDRARGQIVLFGGLAENYERLADTWIWDGAWTQVTPAQSPPARSDHAMAYDPVLGRVILHGGLDAASAALGDTWTFDGTSWIEATVPGSEPRHGHVMATDEEVGFVMLAGGRGGNGNELRTTRGWDGATWHQLHGSYGVSQLGWHPSLRRMVTSTGELQRAAEVRPEVAVSFELGEILADAEEIDYLQLDVIAGADAWDRFTPEHGFDVELFNWKTARWEKLAADAASIETFGSVSVRFEEALDAYLDSDHQLRLRVISSGDGGAGLGYVYLLVDYVHLTVHYRQARR